LNGVDLVLTHGYSLHDDPQEQAIMRPYPPLGALYIASHLKAKGLAIDVFDTTFLGLGAFRAYLFRERPRVVGVYCNLMTRPRVMEMIRDCRSIGAHVIVGGPEPANYADEYLESGADVVVVGEGERTLEELVPHLHARGSTALGHIAGIVYKDDRGRTKQTAPRASIEDLDAQPFPDRAAIDLDAYLRAWRSHHGMSAVSLITARGCPFKCDWCSHSVYGHSHRRRSPKNVADEVELILGTYRPDTLWYADDVFTINRRWFREYALELERRGIRIPFETISREDRLDEETIETLAKMGCFRLWIGAESGSQRILDAMQRQTDAARVREMIKSLQRHKIEAGTFIMLGYDGEEIADLEATVAHLKAAPPDHILTTVAYPIKGTPYYEKVKDRVVRLKVWNEGSDRDFTVAGRRSKRFYRYADRWLHAEVELERQRTSARPSLRRIAKAFVHARIGRLGMWVAEDERESDQPRAATIDAILACPGCRQPLETEGEHRRRCPIEQRSFEAIDGIWRFLLAERETYFAPFLREYGIVRADEGRGTDDPSYYRRLPFEDRSGRHPDMWTIRATSFRALADSVLPRHEKKPLKIALDLGAGNGWLAYRLAERGWQAAAVDLSTDRLDGLGAKAFYDRSFAAIQAEFERLPIASGQVDLVIFNASFHYATDYAAVLSEAKRVLAPGGEIVILDTPIYEDGSSGRRMVLEREEAFLRKYGFRSNALPSENYLTYARLPQLERQLGLSFRVIKPYYGLRWAVRPLRARLSGGREPAKFHLLVASSV
jgi:radical SAM superfamily enzyme YgiQ (UPF0313 family)/SAM-dependent methyltransferase